MLFRIEIWNTTKLKKGLSMTELCLEYLNRMIVVDVSLEGKTVVIYQN